MKKQLQKGFTLIELMIVVADHRYLSVYRASCLPGLHSSCESITEGAIGLVLAHLKVGVKY